MQKKWKTRKEQKKERTRKEECIRQCMEHHSLSPKHSLPPSILISLHPIHLTYSNVSMIMSIITFLLTMTTKYFCIQHYAKRIFLLMSKSLYVLIPICRLFLTKLLAKCRIVLNLNYRRGDKFLCICNRNKQEILLQKNLVETCHQPTIMKTMLIRIRKIAKTL